MKEDRKRIKICVDDLPVVFSTTALYSHLCKVMYQQYYS